MYDLSPESLRQSYCFFSVDRVPGDPATTAWKRRARLGQALWREARAFPIGAQPYEGGPESSPVGSRLSLDFARKSASNFLSPDIARAVRHRLDHPEAHQTLLEARLWADLLSSMPLCFNLFGELHAEGERARRAVRAWWPLAPPGEVELLFEHSPGRRDPAFLGNRSAMDVAFEIVHERGRAVVGVETKYHEHARAEPPPRPEALARYVELTERAGIFARGWRERLIGTELQQLWLDHLLVLSMLQHPSRRWTWGRFVLVHPASNPNMAAAAARYRETLENAESFEARSIETLVGTPGALSDGIVAGLRERYLLG